jgi:hypothetical protein
MRSISDILSSSQNIATALSNIAQTYLNAIGVRSKLDITATTLVYSTAGRIATVVVTVAGSSTGAIYDSNNASITTGKVFVIPNTVGITVLNFPVTNGIVVVPGTGQTVSVSYS